MVGPALGAEPVQHSRSADDPDENQSGETHLDDSGPHQTGPDHAQPNDTQSADTESNVAESGDIQLDDAWPDHPRSGGVPELRRGSGSRQGAPVPR